MARRFISLCLFLALSLCGLSLAQDIEAFEKAHSLYTAANQSEEAKKIAEAKTLYQAVLKDYPLSEFAAGARLHYSRFNVLTQLADGNEATALAEIEDIETNFEKHPDFPWYLYGIGNCYEDLKRDSEANSIYERILTQYPDSRVAGGAKLHYSRYKVLAMIADGNEAKAEAEIKNMEANFEKDPDWPWYLYGIANQYEEKKNYQKAQDYYQTILQECSESPVAANARLHFSRYKVLSLIADGNEAQAWDEIDRTQADFQAHPDWPWYLYGIGNQYEELRKDNEANSIYLRILTQYPDSPVDASARLHHSRYHVASYIIDGNETAALAEIDTMAADCNSHPDWPWYLLITPEKCYQEGLRLGVKTPAGNKLMHFALELLDRYMLGKVWDKESQTNVYYLTAITNYQLDEPEKTIEYSEKLLQMSPDFRFAANMQWLIADGYERMKVLRQLPAEQIYPVIEDEYQILLDGYPDHPLSDYAAIRLGQINLAKGNQTKACAYFGLFLMNADADDSRIAEFEAIMKGCGR
jgi:tetratricopeptide (TPR) repeat protein